MSKVSSFCLQDFGQVPEYLLQRNEEERRAQERHEDFLKEQREQAAMKRLSEEERQAVLEVSKKHGYTVAVLYF